MMFCGEQLCRGFYGVSSKFVFVSTFAVGAIVGTSCHYGVWCAWRQGGFYAGDGL